jgi:metallo-beta-lactamase class B
MKKLLIACALVLVLLPAQTRQQDLNNYQSLLDAWNQPFKPFHVIGNINYVGTSNLACFLISTSKGLILLDTGMEESGPLIRTNIETLGFKVADVKIILSSHAHFDHVGGLADMKAITGATVYATGPDADILESGGVKGFHPLTKFKPVKVDRRIKDGEVIRLGEVRMTAHLTPGHTEGNTTWTTTINEDGKPLKVVFVGSVSINPGVHLVHFAAWPEIAQVYARSFAMLRKLQCDVFLGPHAPFFHMEEKVKRMNQPGQPNPFIDPNGLKEYLDMFEARFNEQLKRERAENG